MGVLGTGAGLVDPAGGGEVVLAVGLLDIGGRGGRRFVGDPQRVGTHIGDQAHRPKLGQVDALIEGLGDPTSSASTGS